MYAFLICRFFGKNKANILLTVAFARGIKLVLRDSTARLDWMSLYLQPLSVLNQKSLAPFLSWTPLRDMFLSLHFPPNPSFVL